MSLRLVRCPFCGKRFNVAGITPGMRLKCGGCTAVLTVPRSDAAPAASRRRRLALTLEVGVGLAAGILAAAAVYALFLRAPAPPGPATAESRPAAPDQAPPSAETAAVPESARIVAGHADLVRAAVYREFGQGFTFLEQRPYLLAVQSPQRYLGTEVMEDYAKRLETLYKAFHREFADALPFNDVNDVLPVVVLTPDAFRLYTPMPSPIKGIYEYHNRRIVVYHDASAPYEVLFHEGVHQLVHHYTLRTSEFRKPEAIYWFQEGLGCYFEGFRLVNGEIKFDPTADHKRLPILRRALLEDGKSFIPLTVLTELTVDAFWKWWEEAHEKDPEAAIRKAHLYYAESWALVYFLRQKGGNYRKTFEEYFRWELEGKGGRAPFEAIVKRNLKLELTDLQSEWRDFLLNLR